LQNKVTVLTTVFNGKEFLKEAIESTLNQTYKNFDFLIIDDCSLDNSVSIIKSYDDPRIKLVRNNKNLGTAETINKALSLIDSKYVVRLDQDDVSLPNRIEEQIRYLNEFPNLDIVCSWEHTIDQNGKILRDWKTQINNYGEFIGPVLLGLCPIWHPSIAFKKQSMINVGGFNKKYTRAEDFEVTVRMALKRLNAGVVPQFLLLQREHQNRQSVQFEKEQKKMNKKVHNEALNFFIKNINLNSFVNYLSLESKSSFEKKDLIRFSEILNILLKNVAKKQNLNNQEVKSLKKVFIKRIGLGLFYSNKFKFLPNIFFKIIFQLLSPLANPVIRKFLSNIYRIIKSK
jgi:glycosyltransferase involved in cell wall biosynthesis